MVAADESEVEAVIGAGPVLADAARRCWDEGRAILPLNPAFTGAEIDRLIDRLRPTIVDGARRAGGLPAAGGTAAVVVTSGTTGEPKGVELTVEGMRVMGRAYSDGLAATSADRWLACLPLHHVASLGVIARSYVTGVPYVVHEKFDVDRIAGSPRAEGTTMVSVVPTALRRLLDAGAPMHEFRRVIVGGAPCTRALRRRAEDAGVTVVDAYGLSETWGGFALDGLPIAGAEVRCDDATGEVLVRGAMVMRGYRCMPQATEAVLTRDGWLHTGDVGRISEDGRVEVVDRLKDIIITGGVNVSPTEVEHVLAHHPDVDDVCVAGIVDEEWGERVVAFVVARAGRAAPSLAELRAFGAAELSAPKLPREVRVRDAIPRSASGKPLRRLLRDAT